MFRFGGPAEAVGSGGSGGGAGGGVTWRCHVTGQQPLTVAAAEATAHGLFIDPCAAAAAAGAGGAVGGVNVGAAACCTVYDTFGKQLHDEPAILDTVRSGDQMHAPCFGS